MSHSPSSRRSVTHVTTAIAVTAGLAAALTGCSSTDPDSAEANGTDTKTDYVQVCQDKNTGQRTEDEKCEDGEHDHTNHAGASPFLWYYLGMMNHSNSYVPAVGSRLSGGTTDRPGSGLSNRAAREGGNYYSSATRFNGTGRDFSSGKQFSSNTGAEKAPNSYTSRNGGGSKAGTGSGKSGVYGGKGGGAGSGSHGG